MDLSVSEQGLMAHSFENDNSCYDLLSYDIM
jgi:hypothetical protein